MKTQAPVRTIVLVALLLITTSNAAPSYNSSALPDAGTAASQPQDAVLSVTSGFPAQPGTMNPLAGRALLLMKESFAGFLTRMGMFQMPPGSTEKVLPLAAWAYSCRADMPVCKQALYEAQATFAGNTKMDAEGKATFASVPAGTYYVFGQAVADNQHLVWDLRVDLRPGANSVVLTRSNSAPLEAEAERPIAPAAEQRSDDARLCQAGDVRRPVKSTARASGTLSVRGTGYVYTYTETDRQTGATTNSFTERGNFINTTLYLLDEDADVILQRAGVEPGLLGSRLAMFTFLDAGTQVGNMPALDLMSSLFGHKEELEEFTKEREAEFKCVMEAIRAHSVAEVTTDENALATFTGVPAGTYYLFGRFYRITKPVRGGGVLWNHRIEIKPGHNSFVLSVSNAALK